MKGIRHHRTKTGRQRRKKKFIYVCSPLKGDLERNIRKANGYCRFAVKNSVVPIAPHAMFAGFLDDNIQELYGQV
uniref:DUF7768 domain-containing protein n=1 Tax=Sporomusa silvacetica TaxID=55504 RepID=UPI0040385378